MERQAKCSDAHFEILVHPAGDPSDPSCGQLDALVIRTRERATLVLKRREHRVTPDVIRDALDVQRAGGNAGTVVVERNRYGLDPPAEVVSLQ